MNASLGIAPFKKLVNISVCILIIKVVSLIVYLEYYFRSKSTTKLASNVLYFRSFANAVDPWKNS